MKDKIMKFMYGRYGIDELSRFLAIFALIVYLIAVFINGTFGTVLSYAAIIMLIYAYYRMFSKKYEKRRAENAKYLKISRPIKTELKNKRERMKQRKDYKFFRCPNCRTMLRVPRNKGKIRVTCRKCGTAFERKT